MKPVQYEDEKFIRDCFSHGDIAEIAKEIDQHESLLSKEWNCNEYDHKAKLHQARKQLYAIAKINPQAALRLGTWIYADLLMWANAAQPCKSIQDLVSTLQDEHSDVVKAELQNETIDRRCKEAFENLQAAQRVYDAYVQIQKDNVVHLRKAS